jgi:predicted nucleotide-binding protein
MPDGKKYLFASFAHRDSAAVTPIVEALRKEFRTRDLNIDIWVTNEELVPGERWDTQIEKALRDSIGLLAFLSLPALESSFAAKEINLFTSITSDRLIFPIVLSAGTPLPPSLAPYNAVDLSDPQNIGRSIRLIADATEEYLNSHGAPSPISPEAVPMAAAIIADSVRGVRPESIPANQPPDSVFLVHGHDSKRLAEVHTYLTELGVKVVVLAKISGQSQSLLQKFFQFSSDIRFAVVLLTADDLGASRMQYEAEGVGVAALQFRARQNVVFELGFFYGYLGWENVFVISAPPEKVYPNFEPPSDLAGVVFDAIDGPDWKASLLRKLTEAKFKLRLGS